MKKSIALAGLLIPLLFLHTIKPIDSVIEKHLAHYTRPFTVLEIAQCTFMETDTYYLSERYPQGIFVVWDSAISPDQIPSNKKNVVVLSRKRTNILIKRLSEVEHFDLILIRNIRINPKLFPFLLSMGQYMFLELSMPFAEINTALKSSAIAHTVIFTDSTANKSWWGIRVDAPALIKRKYCLQLSVKELNSSKKYEVESTFDKKFLHKTMPQYNKISTSPWEHGINLVTFKVYQGIWPSSDILKKEIKRAATIPQLDWGANNMIVQGNKLSLIDFDCPPGLVHTCNGKQSCPHHMNNFYRWIDTFDWYDVSIMFWQDLFPMPKMVELIKKGII